MSRQAKRKEAPLPNPDDWEAKRLRGDDEPEPVIHDELEDPDDKPASRKRGGGPNATFDFPRDFDHSLFQLIHFKAETGNYSATKEDQPDLHAFLFYIKREYKTYNQDPSTSSLTPEQVKVLEYLHVPLTSRGDDHWNRFFDLLVKYKQTHGHVLVPRMCEVPGLGDWVTDQRRQYKSLKQGQASQLTDDRKEKLENLGFAWTVRNRPEWDHRFKQLLDYKKVHGDCKVPQHYKENKALGKWVAKQREQYKLLKKGQHSFLTPYRLEKLEQTGFSWQIRTSLDPDDGEDFRGGVESPTKQEGESQALENTMDV